MMFVASIPNVYNNAISPPSTQAATNPGGQSPHLYRLIGNLSGVRSSDSGVHEPPKVLPPIMVFIEIRIVVGPGDGLRRRGRARVRYRSGRRR